jgi:chaperonin GroES
MPVKPLRDRIVVKKFDEEQATSAGIVVRKDFDKKSAEGVVVSIGSGKHLPDGGNGPMTLQVGDIVMFAKYAGSEIRVGEEDLIIMREDDVMGVIDGYKK